ncbi:MAG TPA: CHAD domain-containing protein, partial [Steroidobacteraceae bacterium]|nr:CHAD domain-containing protein [Steroidobacteraceae bacterium]
MPKPGAAAAVRAVRAEAGARIAAARVALAAPPSDTTVHAIRRELKRARALLRILRPAVGERAVRRADKGLREIGRSLSAARDPAQLAAQLRETAAASGLEPVAVRVLLNRFAAERRAALKPVATKGVSASLARIARSIARLPVHGDETALAAGFARIYRQAREGYVRARDAPAAEELHGWRRHTKRYWHALELLRPAKPRVIHALARKAHRLADALGTD